MIRDFVLSFLFFGMLMTAFVASFTESSHPRTYLTLRASPAVALAPARITLLAEIHGPITEEWYCPKVEWTWPDGTHSSEESDCPPFGEGEGPHFWSNSVLIGKGEHTFEVEFSKARRTVARARATVEVR